MLGFALRQLRGVGRIGFADCMTLSANVGPSVQVVTAVLETLLLFRCLYLAQAWPVSCSTKRKMYCAKESGLVAPYCSNAFRPQGQEAGAWWSLPELRSMITDCIQEI